VLILEAGLPVPDSREEYVNNFYLALAKTPESPYPALAGSHRFRSRIRSACCPIHQSSPHRARTVLSIGKAPDVSYLVQAQPWIETHDPKLPPQNPPPDENGNIMGLQFSSTFERNGGGTSWHWLGTVVCASSRTISNYRQSTDTALIGHHLSRTAATVALAEKEIGVGRQHSGATAARSGRTGFPAGLRVSDAVYSEEYCRRCREQRDRRLAGARHIARYARRFRPDDVQRLRHADATGP
jgi:hypothetical protein